MNKKIILDPRSYSNLGTMWCFHRRYNLGDPLEPYLAADNFSWWDDMEDYIRETNDIVVMKSLYLYDHSWITISTRPFSSHWDSWKIWFIFATRNDVLDYYPDWKRITSNRIKIVKERLLDEIEVYNSYLRGEV